MKFSVTDVMTLVKQGYKLADIKALGELVENPKDASGTPVADPPSEPTEPATPPTDESTPPAEPEDAATPAEPDSHIKELEDQVKQLSEQLKAAQSANINKDHSSEYKPVNPMADLAELFRKG